MALSHFADRITKRISESTPVILGLDPSFKLMPADAFPTSHNSVEIKASLRNFCFTAIDAVKHLIPAIKPQLAYFEQYGLIGIEVLAEVISYARDCNLLIIMDGKRGDIGTTSQAYASAYLAANTTILPELEPISNPFYSDALTVNPFLGDDTLQPFISTSQQWGGGIFVLVKTSNSGSDFLQDQHVGNSSTSSVIETTVSGKIAHWIENENNKNVGECGFGLIGAVVGATWPQQAKKLRQCMPNTLFLVPGIGAQGGSLDTVKACFTKKKDGVILPISRGILYPTLKNGQSYSTAIRNAAEGFVSEIEKM